MRAQFLTIFPLPPAPLCELLPLAPASASKVEGMFPCVFKSHLPLAPAAELHWHHLSNHTETISTLSLIYRDVLLHSGIPAWRWENRSLWEASLSPWLTEGLWQVACGAGCSFVYWKSFQLVRFSTEG